MITLVPIFSLIQKCPKKATHNPFKILSPRPTTGAAITLRYDGCNILHIESQTQNHLWFKNLEYHKIKVYNYLVCLGIVFANTSLGIKWATKSAFASGNKISKLFEVFQIFEPTMVLCLTLNM